MHNRMVIGVYLYQPTAPAVHESTTHLPEAAAATDTIMHVAHLVQTSVLSNLVIELFPPLHSHSSNTTTDTAALGQTNPLI